MMATIFDKIIRREIPADIVFEDDDILAFRDVNPQAPVHLLVIPKIATPSAATADEATLGRVLAVAAKLGSQSCPDGFRLVTNIGPDGGQSVEHLHVHVLGGRGLGWPPG